MTFEGKRCIIRDIQAERGVPAYLTTMGDQPEYDRDAVIKRLLAEQSQTNRLLDEVKMVIRSDKEFDGLSLVGGVKTIIRRYREEKDKNMKLERELSSMLFQKKR